MPKFYCVNDDCENAHMPVDVDMGCVVTCFADQKTEFSDFFVFQKKIHCKNCGSKLEFFKPEDDRINVPAISKWKNASWEEKRAILKKRSNDQSIQYNRECKERKEHFERERYKEVR